MEMDDLVRDGHSRGGKGVACSFLTNPFVVVAVLLDCEPQENVGSITDTEHIASQQCSQGL